MNEYSSGSVMPVTNEVSAADSMMPPTSLRFCGLAFRQIASAPAGSANIMIGKNPVWKMPAEGSPARKRGMSPCTMSPAAFVKLPSWNHGKKLSSWCRPTGMSMRFANPKIPPPITALSATAWPAAVSAMSK